MYYKTIKAADQLPEIISGKSKPYHVIHEQKNYDGGKSKSKAVAYYFPDRFKTIEFEDYDDYSPEDFPYIENDIDKGVLWLKAGWYLSVDCDNCDGYWSAPLNVIEWLSPFDDEIQQKINDYEEVLQSHRDSVKLLDKILNGENAAKQASLIDLLGQARQLQERVKELSQRVMDLDSKLYEKEVELAGKDGVVGDLSKRVKELEAENREMSERLHNFAVYSGDMIDSLNKKIK